MPYCENASAVIYFVTASDYDRRSVYSTRVLDDSVLQFQTIANSHSLKLTPLIILFTKFDLLEEKIASCDIKQFHPEFRGDSCNIDHVKEFLVSIYDNVRSNAASQLFYSHFVTLTDTESFKLMFQSMKDSILSNVITRIMRL